MSDVFLSYKREDEARAGRLALALQAAGLDVWWDRGLPGGESWRANIEKELHAARCVVVVWSRMSVAPRGHFVRDEAGHAMARDLLVPVKIDKVTPPLGFRELQAIDLTHWRDNPKDPFFQDLVAAIRAKLDHRPAPQAKGPAARLWRRLSLGGMLTTAVGVAAGLAFNFHGVATGVCTLAAMQPALSDGCGAAGIGGRPTRAERLFWTARRPGSCEDVRAYVGRFPDGAYLTDATALLAARRVTVADKFIATDRLLDLFVGTAGTEAGREPASRGKAMALAQDQAARACRAFAQSTLFKFDAAGVQPQRWTCDRVGGNVSCSMEGQSVCHLQERHAVERESCGG
jgi:TIR domain